MRYKETHFFSFFSFFAGSRLANVHVVSVQNNVFTKNPVVTKPIRQQKRDETGSRRQNQNIYIELFLNESRKVRLKRYTSPSGCIPGIASYCLYTTAYILCFAKERVLHFATVSRLKRRRAIAKKLIGEKQRV